MDTLGNDLFEHDGCDVFAGLDVVDHELVVILDLAREVLEGHGAARAGIVEPAVAVSLMVMGSSILAMRLSLPPEAGSDRLLSLQPK